MGSISKVFLVLLAGILLASSLMMIESVFAQSIPKPSVPEFTVVPSGPSFDIPPTYSFNSSTGLFDTNDGYHIQYSTVKIIIKNQPFSNQSVNDHFFYNVRIKPHNYPDSYWIELFSAGADGYPIQTLSNYTTIPLAVEGAQALGPIIPTGATTDIQVEAMIGHIGRNNTMIPYPYPYVFFGETSGWSNTQTVTLPPKTAITASPSPTPTPTVPELSWLAILPLSISLLSTAVLIRKRNLVMTVIKKSFIAMCTVLMLVISILNAMQVEVVEANPLPFPYMGEMPPDSSLLNHHQ